MPENEVTTPVQEAENVVEAQEPKVALELPAQPADNGLTPEKRAEYRMLLNASKQEALRLKKENEELKAAKAESSLKTSKVVEDQFTEADVNAFKHLAQKAGVITKTDLEVSQVQAYKDEQDDAVKKFLVEHPEYSKAGDPVSDALWQQLDGEVATYKSPPRGKDYYQLLKKAHKVIKEESPVEYEKGKAMGMAQAQMQEQAKIGGGGGGSKAKPIAQSSPEKAAVSAGFASTRPEYYK